MAYHIAKAPGRKIVAVVGAAHLPGIQKNLPCLVDETEIEEICHIPEKPRLSKIIPWLIPAVVVALFVVGFFPGRPCPPDRRSSGLVFSQRRAVSLGCHHCPGASSHCCHRVRGCAIHIPQPHHWRRIRYRPDAGLPGRTHRPGSGNRQRRRGHFARLVEQPPHPGIAGIFVFKSRLGGRHIPGVSLAKGSYLTTCTPLPDSAS